MGSHHETYYQLVTRLQLQANQGSEYDARLQRIKRGGTGPGG